jgi:hypothetical protein
MFFSVQGIFTSPVNPDFCLQQHKFYDLFFIYCNQCKRPISILWTTSYISVFLHSLAVFRDEKDLLL